MVDAIWKPRDVNEALATLYLRLNGYFTTGLIVHTPKWGEAGAEIDCLAIRHPNHKQPDRLVEPSPFLGPRDGRIDLVICEVKSKPAEVAFNVSLRSEPGVLESVLHWAGLFDDQGACRAAAQLRPILNEGLNAESAQEGVLTKDIRVRGLLCCPPATDADLPRGWCLRGQEILSYAAECFNPGERRETCSTRYNFTLWGAWLAPIVRYFKNPPNGGTPSLEALYRHLGAA